MSPAHRDDSAVHDFDAALASFLDAHPSYRDTRKIDDLRAQLKEALSMIQKPTPLPDLITVKLGASIAEVLQLDDPEIREVFGIECEPVGKGRKQIRVRGTSEALGKLLCACLSRARGKQGGWDQPAHYTRSASAAAERLEAVL